jgi:hypothetical protein
MALTLRDDLTLCNYRTRLAQLDPDTLESNREQLQPSLSEAERAQVDVLWPEVEEVLANTDGECLIEIADVVDSNEQVAFRIFVIPWGGALVFAADSSERVGSVVQHDPGDFSDPQTAAALQSALKRSAVSFKSKIRFA